MLLWEKPRPMGGLERRGLFRRATAVSKSALKRRPVKKPLPKSRKAGGRPLRAKTAEKKGSRRSPAARSRKQTVRASRKLIRSAKDRDCRVRGRNGVAVARNGVRTLVPFISWELGLAPARCYYSLRCCSLELSLPRFPLRVPDVAFTILIPLSARAR